MEAMGSTLTKAAEQVNELAKQAIKWGVALRLIVLLNFLHFGLFCVVSMAQFLVTWSRRSKTRRRGAPKELVPASAEEVGSDREGAQPARGPRTVRDESL